MTNDRNATIAAQMRLGMPKQGPRLAFFWGDGKQLTATEEAGIYTTKRGERKAHRQIACYRCGGTGIYSPWHGTCYRCGGRGTELARERVRTLPELNAAREKAAAEQAIYAARYAAEQAALEAKTNAMQEKYQSILDATRQYTHDPYSWLGGRREELVNCIDRAGDEAYATQIAAQIQKVLDKNAAEAATSHHVATVGERIEVTLTIQFTKAIDGRFGTTHLHKMTDVDGNVFVTFCANRLGDKGETIKIKGTVKAHDERDGVAQTILTRCKRMEA